MELFNGRDMSGWTARAEHQWRVVGGVRLNPEDPRRFLLEPGSGVAINGDEGRTLDIRTEREHGSCELHVEYCVPQRSNSGVYLQGQYEIQVLDSYGTPDSELKPSANGGLYYRWVTETRSEYEGKPPSTNASRPPGEWQTLDVTFHAPRFDASGKKTANARFERVVLNGTVIHENVECSGPTRGAWNDQDIPRGPLRLQGDHGPVAYRNIRIRPLE
jgi:hypothetical protein